MSFARSLSKFAKLLGSDGKVPQAALAANVAGNGPAFHASPTSGLSLSLGVDTKVVLPNEVFDTNNCYDTTNSRFTPNVAGYYLATGIVTTGASTWGANPTLQCQIRKNGAVVFNGESYPNNDWSSACATRVVYMNGTTDYLELYAYADSNVSLVQFDGYTCFGATMVRAA